MIKIVENAFIEHVLQFEHHFACVEGVPYQWVGQGSGSGVDVYHLPVFFVNTIEYYCFSSLFPMKAHTTKQ